MVDNFSIILGKRGPRNDPRGTPIFSTDPKDFTPFTDTCSKGQLLS